MAGSRGRIYVVAACQMREAVPGEACAPILTTAGCGHREVIAALKHEIGFSERDAQAAWEATAPKRAVLRCRAAAETRIREFGQ